MRLRAISLAVLDWTMPFPVTPAPGDDPRQFQIQGPTGVRHPIISLLAIDNHTDRVSGLGTAFRIDAFGGYLTAQHVLEAWLGPSRPRSTVVGLLNPGRRAPITGMVVIASATAFRTPPEDIALDWLLNRASSRMSLGCMTLSFKATTRACTKYAIFCPCG